MMDYVVACFIRLLHWTYILAGGVTLIQGALSHPPAEKDYCDTFNATCARRNQMIVMETALYGRMRKGTCITEDHGYIGCHADILQVLDEKCSGRRTCLMSIPIKKFKFEKKDCPDEVLSYLQASYRCQTVMPVYECGYGGKAAELEASNETKYLQPPSYHIQKNYHGTRHCPWSIKTKPGQQINITMYNFDGSHAAESRCTMYAVIKDGNQSVEKEVCGSKQRESVFYVSNSDHVELYLVLHVGSDTPKFLLTYTAIGCADLPPRKNAQISRDHNTMTVKCNYTGETFFLSCTGTEWTGQLHDCDQIGVKDQTQPNGRSTKFNFGLLILVGIGVALGVALGIILLAGILTCFRRSKQDKMTNVSRHTSDPLLSEVTRDSDDASNYYERRVQTLATIGRSPSRVPREMVYKERVWLNTPGSPTRFHTLPCHYSVHQRPPQHGSQQVLSQMESPYCSCFQQQQQQQQQHQPLLSAAEEPHSSSSASNTQPSSSSNTAQTSFITFRPGDNKLKSQPPPIKPPPPATQPLSHKVFTPSDPPPCGTGVRHISAARSLDLLKDSDHHLSKTSHTAASKDGAAKDLLALSPGDRSGREQPKNIVFNLNTSSSPVRQPQNVTATTSSSNYQSQGYFDNSNNKSI